LVIDPILPNLIISDISTTDIVPNENFTLYVKVYNYGGSAAKNVRLMFNGSSNLFSATESISEPQTIDENEEVSFEFDINAGDVDPGGSYISYILMCYEDIIENYYPFESNPVQSIPLYIKLEKEVIDVEKSYDGPKLIISSLTTTTIKPNTNFTLNFKLYNYGGDTAMNVLVMFNESSNLFSTNPSIQGPNIILKNAELEYVFVISAGDVELGKTYKSSILISYWDHAGSVHSFDTTEELAIDLKVKGNQEGILDQSKDLTEKETEPKDVASKASNDYEISSGFALVILGIFILVSTIIFSTIHFKATNRDRYRQKSKSFEEEENRINIKSGDDVKSKSHEVQRKSSVKPIVQSSPAIQKPQPRDSRVSQKYSHPSPSPTPTTKPNQSTVFTQSSQSVVKTPLLPAHTTATSPTPTIKTPTPTIKTPTPTANKATALELSKNEIEEIHTRATPYLEAFDYKNFLRNGRG